MGLKERGSPLASPLTGASDIQGGKTAAQPALARITLPDTTKVPKSIYTEGVWLKVRAELDLDGCVALRECPGIAAHPVLHIDRAVTALVAPPSGVIEHLRWAERGCVPQAGHAERGQRA